MSTLLDEALLAHGGIDNWNRLRTASAALDIGGAVWPLKGRAGMFRNIALAASLQRQHMSITSPSAGWLGTFTPDAVRIESFNGDAAEERRAPRESYRGHVQDSQWDRLHALYFTGYALWTYLSIPFLYTTPGFETEELPEWRENGEVWRRLKVRFPDSIASHSREQVSYFGADGLLRRHDYTVDILGGATGLNYASDYRDVDGIIVPAKRRVYAYEGDYQLVKEPLLVAIDMGEINLT